MNYNVLLTTPKVNIVAKPIVTIVTTKLSLTCTNCGKIGHTLEICHNRKKEVPIILIMIVKSIEAIA